MKIIDNFLKEEDFNLISNLVYSFSFPYFLQKKLNENQKDKINDCYFAHTLFLNSYENIINYSEFFKFFTPLFKKIKIKSLIRAKINFYPRSEKLIIHSPHVDYDFKHKGCILYFNTCDGFTIIKNKKIETISNRALFFDPSVEHSSTSCTNDIGRFNININYF
jgi:hypothetical protein